MSFSVDDLVSSLSSSHIGQEALDLAALQAQLAETLFGGSASNSASSGSSSSSARQMHIQIPTRGRAQHTQPCNTPLARTPSSSFNGWNMYNESRRAPSVPSSHYVDEMEEDERMVEELLLPSSPYSGSGSNTTSSNLSGFPTNSSFYSSSFQSPPQTPASAYASPTFTEPPPPSPSTSASLFTSTDPFYIAQVQASQAFSNNANVNFSNAQQQQQQQQAGFAQNGRLSQSSPFALAPQYHQFSHGQNWGDVTSFKPCATTAF